MRRHRKTRRSCALVSGGVESAALIGWLLKRGDRVFPVYVRSGCRWEPVELSRLRRLLSGMASPRLEGLSVLRAPAKKLVGERHWAFGGRGVPGARSRDEAVYLPGRNLLLAVCAGVFCARRGIDSIALGTLSGNPFPDASRAFFSRLEDALTAGFGRRFRIETPFRTMSKTQVLRRSGRVPWHLTFSCIAPRRGGPCGHCNKCAERLRAFNGVSRPG